MILLTLLTRVSISFIVYILNYANECRASQPMVLVKPNLCNFNQYFDSAKLACATCGTGDPMQETYQEKSDNGFGLPCKCKSRHKLLKVNGLNIKCEPCGQDEVVSLDGRHCINCTFENPFQNTTGTCLPCENGITIEKRTTQGLFLECAQCHNATVPDLAGINCIPCPHDLHYSSNGTCQCPQENFASTGGTCIPNSNLLPSNLAWSTITFQSGQEVKSDYFERNLQAAIYNCKVVKNSTACQVLANLCVLLLYKSSNEQSDSSACSQYLKMTENDAGRPVEWPSNSPWLYYLDDDVRTELLKTNVPNRFSVHNDRNVSQLNLVAATHNIDGKFLGWKSLNAEILSPCGGAEEVESGFTFGVQFSHNCKIRIRQMWDNAELIFYDLFLIHNANERQVLYPIPILIRNLQKNGHLVNRGSEKSKWQLVRRFFLTDFVSGIEKSDERAKVFRYAQDISIMITACEDEDRVGAIFPPLFVISYAEATNQDYLSNVKVPVYFSISYKMEQSKRFFSISVALGVLSTLSLFWTLFQTWGWFRRSGKRNIDVLTLGRFLVLSCGSLSNVFLLVVLCAALNWLIIFKKQSVVHLLLPTPDQEESIMIYISVAFAMKCIHLFDILVLQCSANVFFIDWERPKIKNPPTGGRRTSMKTMEETFGGPEGATSIGSASGISAAGIPKPNIDKQNELAGASIWRAYFVASNWAEMQTIRRVQPSMQLFFTLMFLQVLGFENLAIADPLSNFSREGRQVYTPNSTTCRFAIGASVYLAIAFVQFIIHRVIYERFFEDKLQQFVDLCSVSNVSVFITSMVRYGYYIHGRSTHGKADVNMKEMHEHLRREEEDLCSQRGLLPNTEQQTFEMTLPEGVNEQYKRLLLPLTTYSQTADRMQGSGGHLTRVDIDRVVSTYLMMNKFLSGFIEHAFKDLDYTVKDKLLMESVLDVEFTDVNDRGYFYNDGGHSFDSVLFCGQETTLVLFEVLLFSVVDAGAQDFVLAAVITYLVSKVIQTIRHSAGRRNLVRKALIDERFLC